jgi:hypothetical protein
MTNTSRLLRHAARDSSLQIAPTNPLRKRGAEYFVERLAENQSTQAPTYFNNSAFEKKHRTHRTPPTESGFQRQRSHLYILTSRATFKGTLCFIVLLICLKLSIRQYLAYALFQGYDLFYSRLLKEAINEPWFLVQYTHYIVCRVFLPSHTQNGAFCYPW